jgi:rare lipoprotein A
MIKQRSFLLILGMLVSLGAFAANVVDVQEGQAAYYADSLHGNKTASGERYDKNALTAAHRKLDFGTRVKVTNLENGKSVDVVINDRGPKPAKYIIDLSGAAAEQIGLKKAEHRKVKIEVYGD